MTTTPPIFTGPYLETTDIFNGLRAAYTQAQTTCPAQVERIIWLMEVVAREGEWDGARLLHVVERLLGQAYHRSEQVGETAIELGRSMDEVVLYLSSPNGWRRYTHFADEAVSGHWVIEALGQETTNYPDEEMGTMLDEMARALERSLTVGYRPYPDAEPVGPIHAAAAEQLVSIYTGTMDMARGIGMDEDIGEQLWTLIEELVKAARDPRLQLIASSLRVAERDRPDPSRGQLTQTVWSITAYSDNITITFGEEKLTYQGPLNDQPGRWHLNEQLLVNDDLHYQTTLDQLDQVVWAESWSVRRRREAAEEAAGGAAEDVTEETAASQS